VIDTEDVRKINYLPIFFVGAAVSLSNVLAQSGALEVLTRILFDWIQPFIGTSWLSTLVLYWAAFLYHIVIGNEIAMLATSIPPLMTYAKQHGVDPLALGMIWTFGAGPKINSGASVQRHCVTTCSKWPMSLKRSKNTTWILTMSLEALTLIEAASSIRSGTLSPLEYVQALLARVDAIEPRVQAWTTINRETVLSEARQMEVEAQRKQFRGPLHGVPVGVRRASALARRAGLGARAGGRGHRTHVPGAVVRQHRARRIEPAAHADRSGLPRR